MPTSESTSSSVPQRPLLHFGRDDQADHPTIGIAPLVDIVLLLICFYLVVSRSIQAHEDPLVQLPAMAEQRSLEQQPAELVINLRADDTITVNATATRIEALPDLLSEHSQRAAANGQTLRVVLRADRQQSYRRLDELLDACRQAGLGQTTFRATEALRP